MDMNVTKELGALRKMTTPQLREKYWEVFGDATQARNKDFLIKRIIWRMQALADGDLSQRARRRAAELANDADLRLGPPRAKPTANKAAIYTAKIGTGKSAASRLPMPGDLLSREYMGRTVEVMVLPKGFEYEGQVYRSLSAVAKAITGTHWNGYHFFGLRKQEKAK